MGFFTSASTCILVSSTLTHTKILLITDISITATFTLLYYLPLGGIRLCSSLELVTSEKSGKLAQNKTR